ncbi:hypothetical protein RUND412_010419, partial [Rhizina undulata]
MKNFVLREGAPFPPTKLELEENGSDMEMYYDSEDESDEEEVENGENVGNKDEEEEEEA